jgi:hypothetical protein
MSLYDVLTSLLLLLSTNVLLSQEELRVIILKTIAASGKRDDIFVRYCSAYYFMPTTQIHAAVLNPEPAAVLVSVVK